MAGFTFDGVQSSSFFLVNRVGRSVLPPVSPKQVPIPGRPGAYDFGDEIGVREFSIEFTMLSTSAAGLATRIRDLADWLNTDGQVKKLVFDDEPDKTYDAKFTGDTSLDTVVSMGTGTIKFVCPDPYAYGSQIVETLQSATATVNNLGYAKTYPVINATFTKEVPYFAISNGTDTVLLGETEQIDKPATSRDKTVLNDVGADLSVWQTSGSVDDINGPNTVSGAWSVFGGYAYKPSDYGADTAPGWHGPVVKRALPAPIADFRVSALVETAGTDKNQIGRIGFNLCDANGAVFGTAYAKDSSSSTSEIHFHGTAGPNGGVQSIYYGAPKNAETAKAYVNKALYIELSRIGKKWELYCSQIDLNTNEHFWGFRESWTDTKGAFSSYQLAQIQIFAYQYKNLPVLYSQWVHGLSVQQIKAVDPAVQVAHIVEAGDTLTIDCAKAAVYKNGKPALWMVNPASDFFALVKGPNSIAYDTADSGVTVTVKHNRRWL